MGSFRTPLVEYIYGRSSAEPEWHCDDLRQHVRAMRRSKRETHAVKDGRQPAPLRQRRDEQAVHLVVDDDAGGFVVERVDGLVVAVLLVRLDCCLLSAVTRVCKEERM